MKQNKSVFEEEKRSFVLETVNKLYQSLLVFLINVYFQQKQLKQFVGYGVYSCYILLNFEVRYSLEVLICQGQVRSQIVIRIKVIPSSTSYFHIAAQNYLFGHHRLFDYRIYCWKFQKLSLSKIIRSIQPFQNSRHLFSQKQHIQKDQSISESQFPTPRILQQVHNNKLKQLMDLPSNTIFTVSEQCTEQEVSYIYEKVNPQESFVISQCQSYIEGSSFIRTNLIRIGLQKLNRTTKVKIRQFKRNALETLKSAKDIRYQIPNKQKRQFQKSKSMGRIELFSNMIDKNERKALPDKSPNIDCGVSGKSNQNKQNNEPTVRMSTKQSTIKKTPKNMYFKQLRQSIMNIKSELNQLQKTNSELVRQNRLLKMNQRSSSMRSLDPFPGFDRKSSGTKFVLQRTPLFQCIDCGKLICAADGQQKIQVHLHPCILYAPTNI